MQLVRVPDFDSALNEANNTRFGLSAGLLCDDFDYYKEFRRKIKAGVINWNRPTTGASSRMPFGGTGASGNHRPGAYFTIDHCVYPVASMETGSAMIPDRFSPDSNLDLTCWEPTRTMIDEHILDTAYEINFDWIAGPTHNYGGLLR